MKNIENIREEEKVKTKKVLAGFTAAAIAAVCSLAVGLVRKQKQR